MYVHHDGIDMYIHGKVKACMYIVQTCMYMFIQVYTRFDSYKHVHIMYKHVSVPYFLFTYMYVKVCTADVPCTDGYIHWQMTNFFPFSDFFVYRLFENP